MSDDEDPKVPAWQQKQQPAETSTGTPPDTDSTQEAEPTEKDATLEQARKFLNDEAVRSSSVEKKTEFLRTKGFSDAQIQQLLSEDEPASEPATESGPDGAWSSSRGDSPPIVTYPEFLTKSPRPPPLLTPSRLLNILTVSGSLWTLLYGTARYVVRPMVENLNDSRSDYYAHVDAQLTQLLEKLENSVSEIPYKNGKLVKVDAAYTDDDSIISDPTELFHRDIGTQTSPPPSLPDFSSQFSSTEHTLDAQVNRLATLRASLQELTDMYTQRAENSADLSSLTRELHDDVDKLGYPAIPDYVSMGYGRSTEPDDEIKKTKDAIRSVKGLFLSARSFPAVTAR
jgi:hypothetical protein